MFYGSFYSAVNKCHYLTLKDNTKDNLLLRFYYPCDDIEYSYTNINDKVGDKTVVTIQKHVNVDPVKTNITTVSGISVLHNMKAYTSFECNKMFKKSYKSLHQVKVLWDGRILTVKRYLLDYNTKEVIKVLESKDINVEEYIKQEADKHNSLVKQINNLYDYYLYLKAA